MKISQSVIILSFIDGGDTYIFGSLSAIYSMFTPEQVGISYAALRNAVSKYIKENNVNENDYSSRIIYETKNGKIVLQRAPLLLANKANNI